MPFRLLFACLDRCFPDCTLILLLLVFILITTNLRDLDRGANRRNYLSGTYLESIKLKDSKEMVIVNNRIWTATTIS